MNVFLVQESDAMRALLCRMIAHVEGMVVTGEFIGATRAIAAVQSAAPALILLDLQLAEGCGIDVLRVTSRDYPDIKVIVMTHFADPSLRRHVMTAGAYAVFDKSRELEDLWLLLQRLAGRGALPTAGTAAAAVLVAHGLWRNRMAPCLQPMRACGATGQAAATRAGQRRRPSKARP